MPFTKKQLLHPSNQDANLSMANSFTDLEKAEGHELLWVDRNGQALSLERSKAAILRAGAAQLGFVGVLVVLYTILAGTAIGLGAGAVLLGIIASQWIFQFRIYQATKLHYEGLVDESETKWRALLPYARFAKGSHGSILRGLTAIALKRGDYLQALQYTRQAIAADQNSHRRMAHRLMSQCIEIMILCNLHEFALAKSQFQAIKQITKGDYVLVLYWTTRLYLEFCLKQPTLPEEKLWELSQAGLRMNRGAALLSLCAWNYQRLGHEEMVIHLLKEAKVRISDGVVEQNFQQMMPFLWEWTEKAFREHGI